MAALLCALVSWVAMAFEGAVGIDAAAVSAQPNIRTLIDVCVGEIISVNPAGANTPSFIDNSSLKCACGDEVAQF